VHQRDPTGPAAGAPGGTGCPGPAPVTSGRPR
jgi:hypothetical protein